MIKVCDAIMGTGKTSAAITYMNEHPEKKFVYIAPYIEQDKEVLERCPDLDFYEPERMSEHKGSKILHTIELISKGKNVATTHQAFKGYPVELLGDIKEKGYTLIIDENVDILEVMTETPADVQIAIDAGYVTEDEGGAYVLKRDVYDGRIFRDFFRMAKTRSIIRVDDTLLYWQLSPELVSSFEDVYILTYLFEGQSLYHFLRMYGFSYEYIGIGKSLDRGYYFTDEASEMYRPEYLDNLKEMIHILDNDKMNAIGRGKFALSQSWFERGGENTERLRKNVYNFFNNICHDYDKDQRICGTFKSGERKIRGKGYSKSFVPFNQKGVNKYGDRTVVAYCVNVFMNVGCKCFYQKNGVEVDEDKYALSVMVQWIWRSAIRNGKPIILYIPSRRMRELLINWMDEVSSGGTQDVKQDQIYPLAR